MDETERITFAQKHPGWEAWKSIKGGQWHARKLGSEPLQMVHDDHPEGLGEQVRALEAGKPLPVPRFPDL